MTYYYNNESEQIETEKAIAEAYVLFADEYESYQYFKSCCMYWNNGALHPIKEGKTHCRLAIGHCTESEQTLVFVIDSVDVENQRVKIRCINSVVSIPSETVSIYQINLI